MAIKIMALSQVHPTTYDSAIILSSKVPDNKAGLVKMPSLAVPYALYQKEQALKKTKKWDESHFRDEFAPEFIKAVKENPRSLQSLQDLVKESWTKEIALTCYCSNERLCHRYIIAGILKNMGANIQTDSTYTI